MHDLVQIHPASTRKKNTAAEGQRVRSGRSDQIYQIVFAASASVVFASLFGGIGRAKTRLRLGCLGGGLFVGLETCALSGVAARWGFLCTLVLYGVLWWMYNIDVDVDDLLIY